MTLFCFRFFFLRGWEIFAREKTFFVWWDRKSELFTPTEDLFEKKVSFSQPLLFFQRFLVLVFISCGTRNKIHFHQVFFFFLIIKDVRENEKKNTESSEDLKKTLFLFLNP